MRRAYKANASATPPTASQATSVGFPTEGDQVAGTDATIPGPWVFHMLTEAIVTVIEHAGLTPGDDPDQFRDAVISLLELGGRSVCDQRSEAVAGVRTDRVTSPRSVRAVIEALIAGAPNPLNNLNKLAAAVGDDARFLWHGRRMRWRYVPAWILYAIFTGRLRGLTRPAGDEWKLIWQLQHLCKQSRPVSYLWRGRVSFDTQCRHRGSRLSLTCLKASHDFEWLHACLRRAV